LLTLNIDDLHNREIKSSQILYSNCQLPEETNLAFNPHIYELHGNALYMHCSDESQDHSCILVKAPTLQDFEVAA
jgi:NAD-dependent SIR2 family protein deacetylase